MQAVVKARLLLQTCANSLLFSAELHTTQAMCSKIKRAPRTKADLPSDKSSLGRLVSRGMLPKEVPNEYTARELKVLKTGGRGLNGHVEIRRIGGGLPVTWHMADLLRINQDEADPKVEVVKSIIPEQTRSAYLALVIGGEKKRWIIATDNMQVGDLIKSTRELPLMPIQAQAGDCHPVGALPVGTQICCVERLPFQGSAVSNGAGCSCVITKKVGDQVIIKMPSKREMMVSERCLCVVGRVSNTERNKQDLGKAGASRWLGIRPKSGLWLRKTGLAGRKKKPLPKPQIYKEEAKSQPVHQSFTVGKIPFEKQTDFV